MHPRLDRSPRIPAEQELPDCKALLLLRLNTHLRHKLYRTGPKDPKSGKQRRLGLEYRERRLHSYLGVCIQ